MKGGGIPRFGTLNPTPEPNSAFLLFVLLCWEWRCGRVRQFFGELEELLLNFGWRDSNSGHARSESTAAAWLRLC